jgi:hypothetical protein
LESVVESVVQQLRLLGPNPPLKAVAVAAALAEAIGDEVDALMLEGLELLASGGWSVWKRSARLRAELERAVLAAWPRVSPAGCTLARKHCQPVIRRVLVAASMSEQEAVRRHAIDMAGVLAGDRDELAWRTLRGQLADGSMALARAACDAIVNAAERVGMQDPEAESAVLDALRAYPRHRSERLLRCVVEHADQTSGALRRWLCAEPGASGTPGDDDAEIVQQALRSATKHLPLAVIDRQIATWITMPCLAPAAARRLQDAAGTTRARGGSTAERAGRVSTASRAWQSLFAQADPFVPAVMASALRRIGAEVVAVAAAEHATRASVVRLVVAACRSNAQRQAALLTLLGAQEPSVRMAAALELGRLVPTAASDQALSVLVGDPCPAIACAAASALARMSSLSRHAKLDAMLSPFADRGEEPVQRATALARRLTDPSQDLAACAGLPPRQAWPWRAPVVVRAALTRDPQTLARSLERIATDPARTPAQRRAARVLLDRVLPMPARVRVRPAAMRSRTGAYGATGSDGAQSPVFARPARQENAHEAV